MAFSYVAVRAVSLLAWFREVFYGWLRQILMAESECWQVATSVLVARFASAHHFGTRPGTRKLKDKGHCEDGRLACWLGIEWVARWAILQSVWAVGFSLALWKRKKKKTTRGQGPPKADLSQLLLWYLTGDESGTTPSGLVLLILRYPGLTRGWLLADACIVGKGWHTSSLGTWLSARYRLLV